MSKARQKSSSLRFLYAISMNKAYRMDFSFSQRFVGYYFAFLYGCALLLRWVFFVCIGLYAFRLHAH